MLDIINLFDKYHLTILVILVSLSVGIFGTFLWVWVSNRKKFNHLKHQIPASVVKSYLDSLIHNSNALKSSLFRGGGMDIDPSQVPSVMPLSDLPGGTSVNLDGIDDSALKAEIEKLRVALADKEKVVKDLETQNIDLSGEVKNKQERIEELERLLAEKEASSGIDPSLIAKLEKERDDLKDELASYEVVSSDLADLKKYKQENEQLKKALEAKGEQLPVSEEIPEEAQEATEDPEAVVEPETVSVVAEDEASEEAAETVDDLEETLSETEVEMSSEDQSEEANDNASDDLLSEFEKMLG